MSTCSMKLSYACILLLTMAPLVGCSSENDSIESTNEALTQTCFVPPTCDAPPPNPGKAAGFHKFSSLLKSMTGTPNHRVHDLLLAPNDAQWVIGTFAYDGLGTANLEGEDVNIYVLRGCGAAWESLGTARTTNDSEHATVEGVADSGGHVYFEIPAEKALGLGRHRVHLVVRGDLTSADGFIEVQPQGSSTMVTDIDGTLTSSDFAEVAGIVTNTIPDANPGSVAALTQLAAAGYRPIYLTGRTESEVNRTRTFLSTRGFPAGILRTSQGNGLIGLSGSSAVTYKASEIRMIQGHGMSVSLGIGNMDTDAQAYQQTSVGKDFLYQSDAGNAYGGRRFDSYATLVTLVNLPALCAPPLTAGL